MSRSFVGVRICDCGKEFGITRVQSLAPHKAYCSRECFYKYRKQAATRKPYVYTKPRGGFKKGQKVMGVPFKKGHIPANFKGEDVGYDALHDWINRHAGRAGKCCVCESEENVHWANKDGEYKRNLEDWVPMCASCHKRHDQGLPNSMERKYPEWYEKRKEYRRQYRANNPEKAREWDRRCKAKRRGEQHA